ncbi:MAG: CDP-diacylglycerol--glycerol-3-phosphate 3-phosphatidyltransferase [Ignavibacteriae bacterium HGW-Ignavibacteriae-3]|nr:MAG: CDP-diacylglycerol--glycerol-3-phosphate 3-phosphatidyltransferase [Ignavibacteriae bacterium HGW-Ignavibacteriae-3]
MVLPNQLTVLRIILTPVFLVLFLSGEPWMIQVSYLVFIIAAITDWYDGWLARKFNYITEWGKFMDPLADKILTSTAFMAFVLVGILPMWMVLIIIIRDILITLLRIYADHRKISFTTSRTAQVKTFIQMFFLYYLLLIYTLNTFEKLHTTYYNLFEILLNRDILFYSMLFITLFTLITGISYIFSNRYLIKQMTNREN